MAKEPPPKPENSLGAIVRSVLDYINGDVKNNAGLEGVSIAHLTICMLRAPGNWATLFDDTILGELSPELQAQNTGKTSFCKRTGKNTENAWQLPLSTMSGDCVIAGGICIEGNLVVAMSGFGGTTNINLATMVAGAISRRIMALLAWHTRHGNGILPDDYLVD